MTIRSLLHSILLIQLLSLTNVFAANQCVEFFSVKQVKRVGAVNLRPPVTQCLGTCYFESYIRVLEYEIQTSFSESVSISRVQAMSSLLKHLLSHTLKKSPQDFLRTPSFRRLMNHEDRIFDFVSGGNALILEGVLSKNKILITHNKSKEEIEEENLRLKKLVLDVSSLIYKFGINTEVVESVNTLNKAYSDLILKVNKAVSNSVKNEEKRFGKSYFSYGSERSEFGILKDKFTNDERQQLTGKIVSSLKGGKPLLVRYFSNLSLLVRHSEKKVLLDVGNSERLRIDERLPRHAAIVTHVHLNNDGTIKYLELQDSNSSKLGDNGQTFLTLNYLLRFGIGLYKYDIDALN